MLVGVAAVALGFYIARVGELTTLSWLVSTLIPYVVFALIVVFQAEIRHTLANLGSRLTFSRASSSPTPMTTSCWRPIFLQNQTGALIVIEREIGLRNLHRERRAARCALSYDLLVRCSGERSPA